MKEKAIKLGYDMEALSLDNHRPIELNLNRDNRFENEYYEKIMDEAHRKGISFEEYVLTIVVTLYKIQGAELYLQNYYYKNKYSKSKLDGLGDQEKAKKLEQAFNQYVDELVEEAKAQKGKDC